MLQSNSAVELLVIDYSTGESVQLSKLIELTVADKGMLTVLMPLTSVRSLLVWSPG